MDSPPKPPSLLLSLTREPATGAGHGSPPRGAGRAPAAVSWWHQTLARSQVWHVLKSDRAWVQVPALHSQGDCVGDPFLTLESNSARPGVALKSDASGTEAADGLAPGRAQPGSARGKGVPAWPLPGTSESLRSAALSQQKLPKGGPAPTQVSLCFQ